MEIKNNYEQLEFRQIILAYIKKILDIASTELRNHTRQVITSNFSNIVQDEDTRISYIQAIENLSYVLTPYFDIDMQKTFNECIPILTGYHFEVRELLSKEYNEIKVRCDKEKIIKSFAIEMKVKYAKKLFIALNQLLKRNDYLKASVYGEEEFIEDKEDIRNE